MLIYAGIDEAGYGPMFGPLVVARTVFAIEDHASGSAPPCMWKLLRPAVCRSGRDRRRRIAIDDSKKLYTPATGLERLERGVISFANHAGHAPNCLDELLAAIALDGHSICPRLLWYHDELGGPSVPSTCTAGQLKIATSQLRRASEKARVQLVDKAAAVVYEDQYNQIVRATRSKAACAWKFVAEHLWAIWQTYGEHHPHVVVDRQGGRKVYHPQLQLLFDRATLRLIDESDDVSSYHIADRHRAITISFETFSDGRHMPVALASMTAKYLREMLMVRFNRFWRNHAPQIRPTAGYTTDGRRFLAEIDMHIDRLGIDRATLIRSR